MGDDLYASAVAVADGYRPTLSFQGRIVWEGGVVDEADEAQKIASAHVARKVTELFAG